MKQLYATGPLASSLLSPTMRATTAGLGADDLHNALSFCNYAMPPARGSDAGPLPVRLALLNTANGRVLTHITPNGKTYFAHSLLNVPSSADAQHAIQTWGSTQWQKYEPDNSNELPDLPYLPVADVLDDAGLQAWLAEPQRRDLLEFALAALLGTPATTRIVLAAPADDVAKIVYAITRALPSGLLDDFTFSTYEPDPLRCSARLIGHDTGSSEWELPTACFADGLVAFNPISGKRSQLAIDVPFAAFATKALAEGEYGPLDEVKSTWHRLGLKDARQFDLVYRASHGTGVLTKTEAAEALQYPPLAAWISSRPEAVSQFLDWALDDREFASTSFTRALQTTRQNADVTAKLAQTVRDLGLKALHEGNKTRTANALEVVLPMVAPSKAHGIWGELVAQLTDPNQLSWEIRWYLLPRFVRFKQQQGTAGVDAGLLKWLDVPAEKFGEVLALDLPKAYQVAAGRAVLKQDGEPSAGLTRTLAANPALTLALLQPEGTSTASVALFESLLNEAPGHAWFEDLIANAANYPPELLNKFFEIALAAGKVNADRVIREHGSRLLELFAGQSGLDRVGTLFLASPPSDLLRNSDLLKFLDGLRSETTVHEDLKSRIDAVKSVRAYLDRPSFNLESMKPVAEALKASPPVVPQGTKSILFAAVAEALIANAKSESVQADIETALLEFGEVLANDPADLFENLLRDLRGRTDLFKKPNLLATFLGVALGSAKSPELHGRLDGLDVQAFAVATEAAKRGGNRLLTDLDRRTSSWPKPACTQWSFLLAAVRPRGFRGVVRDAGLVLAGAVVASAAWGIYTLVGQ